MNLNRAALVIAVLATGMVYLDQTAVNIALPAIQRGLGTDLSGIQWILSLYLLFLTAPLLLCGVLGDRFGRRRIFCLGMTLFGFSSLFSGLADNLQQMLTTRAFQGIGAAMMISVGLPILIANTALESRGKVIGLWTGWSAAIIAAGPSIGGLLVDLGSWRLVFFINLPLAMLAIFVAFRWLPADDRVDGKSLDFIGMVLLMVGLGCLIYSLIEATTYGITSPRILGSLVSGCLLLGLFYWHQGRIEHPLIAPQLFRYAAFRMINFVTLLLWIAVSGIFLFLPLNLQQIQNYSALEAGLSLAPISLCVLIISRLSGRWADRYGAGRPLLGGLVCMLIGMLMLANLGNVENYWRDLLPLMTLYGIGLALVVSPLTMVAMTSLPDEHAGVASGVNNSASRIAAMLSIALLGSLMLAVFELDFVHGLSELQVDSATRDYFIERTALMSQIKIPVDLDAGLAMNISSLIKAAYLHSFSIAMYLSSLITFICTVIVYIYFRNNPTLSSARN
ncbi:MAG: EmrB/QacA subfamily drug resistance transporter [Parasphingorhabdus sp.]|jgi:EmrB/QacA subfamily drug resistance transporter